MECRQRRICSHEKYKSGNKKQNYAFGNNYSIVYLCLTISFLNTLHKSTSVYEIGAEDFRYVI